MRERLERRTSSYSQKEIKSQEDNGQLSNEGTYKDSKLDGVFKEWYKNGQLKL